MGSLGACGLEGGGGGVPVVPNPKNRGELLKGRPGEGVGGWVGVGWGDGGGGVGGTR